MVDTEQIGVIQCREDGDHDLLSNIRQEEMSEGDFEDATDATQSMLSSLAEKSFSANKPTARLHEFNPPEGENDDNSIKNLLTQLRDGEDFEDNLAQLAKEYLRTPNSESGILIVVRFAHHGHDLLAIIKAPYENVYEPDEDVGLSEISEIIEDELKKGIIYPRVNYSLEETRPDEVGVYQKNYYAKHWWKFLDLENTKTNEEVLHEIVTADTEEEAMNPLPEVQSPDQFNEASQDLDDQELNADVTITISGIDIRVSLRDIVERNIYLVEDGSYYVVIPGNEPNVAVTGHSGEDYRTPVLENLEEYDSFDDIQE